MPTPTKWDTLLYLSFIESATFNELSETLRHNILFENLNNRVLYKRLSELIDEGLVIKKRNLSKKKTIYCLNHKTPYLNNYMAFLLWSRKEDLDYNNLLSKRAHDILYSILEHGSVTLKKLQEHTGISKSTLKKYLNIFDKNRFLRITKQKPLCIELNINDRTLFYLTLIQPSGSLVKKVWKHRGLIQDIDNLKDLIADSDEFMSPIIKMHVYSTTVTEGNTANREDVERVIKDLPTGLTPREIVEIRNTFDAVDYLNRNFNDLELESGTLIKFHTILMRGLIEECGKYYASSGKRIMGSKLKLPGTIEEIEYTIAALINFYDLYRDHIHPLQLGAIIHFLLVTIHPFKDSNGRVARIIHSLILLKSGYTLFVFDPDKKNRYFDMLEAGRKQDIEGFVDFILEEYKNALETVAERKDY